MNTLLLLLSVFVGRYLFYAMVRPERLLKWMDTYGK